MAKIIRFDDERFLKLYKMPCDSFDKHKQGLIFKMLEILENIRRRKENGKNKH